MNTENVDVVIIGAGPSGALAGALLAKQGRNVLIIEKEYFPRFSIGESLLPQSMVYLEDAGLLPALEANAAALGFQFKNGAAFHKQGKDTNFDFTEKFSPGPGTTYQVKRAAFDKLLADGAAEAGAQVRYGHTVTAVAVSDGVSTLQVESDNKAPYQINARFMLDASGFGRVLPRLLALDKVSPHPTRQAVFTHVTDNIVDGTFDRNKILITVNPEQEDIWYWLIPFSDGTSSLGVVGKPEQLKLNEQSPLATLQMLVGQDPNLSRLLANAEYHTGVRSLTGYSASVERMHGSGFALLGNAGEFLDPVFSSGVTIALHSAWLIAPLVERYLDGEQVDFEAEFAAPLQVGINCFRTYVKAWYTGQFQTVIFSTNQQDNIRRMISSILAGYAWDKSNPYVAQSERRLNVLAQLCEAEVAS